MPLRYAVAVAFLCALLAACGPPASGLPHPDASEVSPQTKNTALLYVAAELPSSNAVLIATYPQGQIIAKITNFQGDP